jgi:hypothetical protein
MELSIVITQYDPLLQHSIYKLFYTLPITRFATDTKTNRLMLFREIIDVYSENHTRLINILCKKMQFSNVKAGSKCSDHCASNR